MVKFRYNICLNVDCFLLFEMTFVRRLCFYPVLYVSVLPFNSQVLWAAGPKLVKRGGKEKWKLRDCLEVFFFRTNRLEVGIKLPASPQIRGIFII